MVPICGNIRPFFLSLFLGSGLAWGQKPPVADPKSPPREWTSTDGRKITASYLGVQNASVVLRLPGGKITFVPTSRFSAEDNAFIQANRFDYRAAWQAWPPESRDAMALVPVNEDKSDPKFPGAFIYKTPHFRFIADVNLGTALMKDLARVFELTYHLQSVSPLGTLAEPENNGLFDAKLFGRTGDYHKAGGPESTAGVYLLKEKVFLAPLDLMGVREGSTGWRKDSNSYDLSTIVHELTHMLTHGMLDNLPTWVNGGLCGIHRQYPDGAKRLHDRRRQDPRRRAGCVDQLLGQGQWHQKDTDRRVVESGSHQFRQTG